jgi:hypothetical protein
MNIRDIALPNKYTKCYLSIVERSKSRASTRKEANKILGYVESHHIVPNCIVANDDVVHLTAREHFICHLLLTKMFSDKKYIQKMNYALSSFLRKNSNQQRLYFARQYEIARIAVSNANKLRKMSDSAKRKISAARTGTKASAETKKKLSEARKGENNSFFGKTHKEETKRKLSDAKKGKFVGEKNPFYGKTHTDEVKAKLSMLAQNRTIPDHVKEKFAKTWKGKKRSEANKEKISAYAKSRFWIVNKEGVLKHCNSLQDPRLLSGEFKLGKKWVD